MDKVRLASIIFENGKKISQSKYETITESIETDRFSLCEYVLNYKKKDKIFDCYLFVLNDGSRILLDEDFINSLNNLNMKKNELELYISESKENMNKIMEIVINGSY